MDCHLCGGDTEDCGCWEIIETIEVSTEEMAMILRDFNEDTIH